MTCLSCCGATFIDTPHIDALCQQGIRYTNAYSEHPVCVPARASLLTGMNAIKTGAPFAMMVGFPGPHSPYDPAPEYAQFNLEDMPEPVA